MPCGNITGSQLHAHKNFHLEYLWLHKMFTRCLLVEICTNFETALNVLLRLHVRRTRFMRRGENKFLCSSLEK